LLLLVAIYVLAAWTTASVLQLEFKVSGRLKGTLSSAGALFCWALGGYAAYVLCVERPSRPTRHILDGIRRFATLERLGGGLLIVFIAPFFLAAFSFYKRLIPTMNPFCWDSHLVEWDQAIHIGAHPWERLQPFMSPLITSTIDVCYFLWFQAMYCGVVWHAFYLPTSRIRMQFLLSFALSWILLGNVAATALSSAGPCYYPSADNPYRPLKDYLTEIDQKYGLYAPPTQDYLWRAYVDSIPFIGAGISAMPSMHVAIAFLLWLAAWKQNRLISVVVGAYAIVILIGSVHLAWHYALDGYVAILGMWLIWHLAGALVRRDPLLDDSSTPAIERDSISRVLPEAS
jgi:hypothetical protein